MNNTGPRKSSKKGERAGSKQRKKMKVLIIDDEPNFVEACQQILEARAYQVITTSSKQQAQDMMAEDPDLKIYLTCPLKERVRRIAKRESRPIEEVLEETKFREENEKDRFLNFYGVDLDDLNIYDVVLNTLYYDIEATARILKKIIDEYLSSR